MHASLSNARFESLLDAHMGIVRKIAASYRQAPEDRADLVQDILAALWAAWPGYDETRRFSTWMYRVALNVAITRYRHARPRTHEPLDEAHTLVQGAADVDFEHRQQRDLVAQAMRALSDTDRALLLLHLDGHTHRDIAEVLGTTEGNVAVRFTRVKARLHRIAGTHQEDVCTSTN